MKKVAWLLKILLPVIILGGVIVSFAGIPKWMHRAKPLAVAPTAPTVPERGIVYSVEEKRKLGQLAAIYDHMNGCAELDASGVLTAYDPADSSATLQHPFRLCRKGKELYYQTGDMEMISLSDMYISVSHKARKIFIGPAKTVLPPFQLPTDSLAVTWQSDNYRMVTEDLPGKSRMRMLCDNHITCKEYRFDYDTAAMAVKQVYMRLTNLRDPLNNKLDKEVSLTVNEWREQHIPAALLKTSTYLVKEHDGWHATAAYAGYDLVSLY